MRIGVRLASLALVAAVLTGCSQASYDGVLWRQIAAYKDPLGTVLSGSTGVDRESFIASLKNGGIVSGAFWTGTSSPETLDLNRGGSVLYDLHERGDSVTFDAMISSGPRNPGGDGHGSSGPYSGPPSIYTCFANTITFDADRVDRWHRDEVECEAALVKTLDEGARFFPVSEFDG